MKDIRMQECSRAEAKIRLNSAEKFLEVALLVESEQDPAITDVAGSLAVLAGIAASDAACCKAFGRRPRGESHAEAVRVLHGIANGGKEAAEALRRLLALKDSAQYGMFHLSREQLKVAMRQADRLIRFARSLS